MTGELQTADQVGADEAGASGDEYSASSRILPSAHRRPGDSRRAEMRR